MGLLSTTLALGALCLAALIALKLLQPRARARGLRVLASLPLDGRRGLYVVEVAGRCLLLGTGEGAPSLVAELDPARVASELARPASDGKLGMAQLRRALGIGR